MPIPEFFPYVFRLYPDARVILTTRRPETWVRSRSEKHGANAPVPVMNLFHGMEADECAGRAREGTHVARWPLETAALAYEFHNSYVRAVVPRDRLLEFTVADGWAPLCDFLGVPEPEGTPFPNMNDRKKMRAFVLFLYVLNYGCAAVALGGGLYAFRRRRVRRRLKSN